MDKHIRSFLVIFVALCVTNCGAETSVIKDAERPFEMFGEAIKEKKVPELTDVASINVWLTHEHGTASTLMPQVSPKCSAMLEKFSKIPYGEKALEFTADDVTDCNDTTDDKMTLPAAMEKFIKFYGGHQNIFADKTSFEPGNDWVCGGSSSSHMMWTHVKIWNDEVLAKAEAKKKRDAAAQPIKTLIDEIVGWSDAQSKVGYAYQTTLIKDFKALIKDIGIPMGGNAARLVFPVAVMFASFMMAVF